MRSPPLRPLSRPSALTWALEERCVQAQPRQIARQLRRRRRLQRTISPLHRACSRPTPLCAHQPHSSLYHLTRQVTKKGMINGRRGWSIRSCSLAERLHTALMICHLLSRPLCVRRISLHLHPNRLGRQLKGNLHRHKPRRRHARRHHHRRHLHLLLIGHQGGERRRGLTSRCSLHRSGKVRTKDLHSSIPSRTGSCGGPLR